MRLANAVGLSIEVSSGNLGLRVAELVLILPQ